ncbi:MAG TPA: nucleoside triphosphate pyrophosphohydrolase [Thermotogota bacterium]|nr:nucleoside triphosphate pyrophosphohydrolase [Thermotogota bacterium]
MAERQFDRAAESFRKLLQIMEQLRAPGGCEWDRKQTHQSLRPYVIEEAYEVAHAIEKQDLHELKEELGDLLLQTVFHAQVASEEGTFCITDVLDVLNQKLVRRHPHVFGDSSGYSYTQWEEIKAKEKGKSKGSRVGKINNALPGLSLARRIQENAAAVGFDWENVDGALEKTREEIQELEQEIARFAQDDVAEKARVEEELGDLLFAIVNVARFFEMDPEIALRKATQKFARRFERMEQLVEQQGLDFEALDLQTLDTFWEQVKRDGF